MPNLIAIILVAGIGKRLQPYTQNTPKCLVEVVDQPILYYQLTALATNGFQEVILVTGYKQEAIKSYVRANFSHLKIKFIFNPDFATTNTLYSLNLAAQAIGNSSNVLLMNGDVVFGPQILSLILKPNPEVSLAAVQPKKCGDEEIKVSLNEDSSISAISKQVPVQKAAGEAIGINKFSISFLKKLSQNLKILSKNHAQDYFELAIEKTISQGEKLFSLDIGQHYAREIDFPEDLEAVRGDINAWAFQKPFSNKPILPLPISAE